MESLAIKIIIKDKTGFKSATERWCATAKKSHVGSKEGLKVSPKGPDKGSANSCQCFLLVIFQLP